MREIVLIVHDLRSAHNVGSLLRTAEGLGIEMVYFTGHTPYPKQINDNRLPYMIARIHNKISKTALGAEISQKHKYLSNINQLLLRLRKENYKLCTLEQSTNSISLPNYKPDNKIALIIGNEVEGIDDEILKLSDIVLEIPMLGQKESYNVAQAAAMALYHLKFA